MAAVNRKIIDITQRNLNLGLDLARSLASARNPFEIAELLASYSGKQFDEVATNWRKSAGVSSGLAPPKSKPREPFSERAFRKLPEIPLTPG